MVDRHDGRRPKSVAVVGGGIGGLAVAIRLRTAGHHVVIYERNDVVGGKLASYERDGYTFDLGPSLITLPHFLDELFRVGGTTLDEQLDMVRLDPQFAYRWRDGSSLTVPDDEAATSTAFEEFVPGAGEQWRNFDARGRRIWDVAERTFFAGPMTDPRRLIGGLRSPMDPLAIDPLRTLNKSAESYFTDPRLVQWAGRYATYSGSSPFAAPATLACIPHIESRFGCWYPMGGLDTLRAALHRVALGLGVEMQTGIEVKRILANDRVTGLELADEAGVAADIVVSNADAEHLYADLLPDESALKRVRRSSPSTSGFVLCIGVRGRTPGLAHHNIWFSGDHGGEHASIAAGRLPEDPTVYACVSSVTDRSQAPEGHENWALLVNTPPGIDVDRDQMSSVVLATLAGHGVDLRDRIAFEYTMTPNDIADRYRSPGGSIYGTSSNGKRAAFVRPANRGARRGLYLVGGSSHPGGGIPLVATSAKIVADLIAEDLGR